MHQHLPQLSNFILHFNLLFSLFCSGKERKCLWKPSKSKKEDTLVFYQRVFPPTSQNQQNKVARTLGLFACWQNSHITLWSGATKPLKYSGGPMANFIFLPQLKRYLGYACMIWEIQIQIEQRQKEREREREEGVGGKLGFLVCF